jgi:DNA-directed RNA polymerase I subunit RPA49
MTSAASMDALVPLVYFTHADLKRMDDVKVNMELVSAKDSHANDLGANLSAKKSNRHLKLKLYDENMNYEGLEEEERSFAVGVIDKANNKITVCNTAFFILKPECYLTSKETETTETSQNESMSSYAEKLDSLTAAFGSAKKRKAMQTKLKNKLDEETLESAVNAAVEESKAFMIESTAKNGLGDEGEDQEALEVEFDRFSIVPRPNEAAQSASQVYILNEVLSLSSAEFERFTSELGTKFALAAPDMITKWMSTCVYPQYVCERLLELCRSRPNHQHKLDKCKQLAYVCYMMQLFKLKSAQLRSKNALKALEVPAFVIDKLYELYTVLPKSESNARSVRSMPRRLKDKLICHILVIGLFIDEFKTSLDSIQKDIKLSIQKLSEFFQALGCHIKTQVIKVNEKRLAQKVAVLSLPLNDSSKKETKRKRSKNT